MVPAPKVQLPTFQDPQLFIQAVTHSSYDGHSGGGASRAQGLLLPLNPALELEGWAWEDQGGAAAIGAGAELPAGVYANERLEFLGDAVLNFLAGEFVYKRYPQKPEGELTALRSALVDERQLSAFARELGLGGYLRLGKSAENQGVRENAKILSCTFEAVVGAYFLDQQSQVGAVRSFVWPLFEAVADQQALTAIKTNYKSRFQEWVQANCPGCLPVYTVVVESGPPHDKVFEVVVQVRSGQEDPLETLAQTVIWGRGTGRSKQAAEKAAAQAALAALADR
ncbi:MAG: ribonuclease III [Prochlorothrix sp.]|nr:ribonuclease III [Prochlorothrix sp.]